MVNTLIVSIIISWLAGLPAISTSGLIIAQTSGLPLTSPLTFSCEGWGGGATEKGSISKPQALQNDTTQTCDQTYINGYLAFSAAQWRVAFDTLTHYIETCPNNSFSPHAFGMITTCIAHLYGPDGGSYRATYLAWLESVLYLNTIDPEYFCACAEEISNTLTNPHSNDTSAGYVSRETNIPLSVLRWLILNTTCDTPYLQQRYDRSRETQLEQWANNPGAYKLDTTLYPISTWGLDTLFAKHFLYAGVHETSGPEIISSIFVSPNPTTEGCVITFGVTKEAYVKLEIYDVLGNRVEIPSLESLFQVGNHAIPLSLHNLASGTYYARLVTAYGEAQTVKIVKQ